MGVKSVVMTCIAQALDIQPHRSQHPGATDALPMHPYRIIKVSFFYGRQTQHGLIMQFCLCRLIVPPIGRIPGGGTFCTGCHAVIGISFFLLSIRYVFLNVFFVHNQDVTEG